MTLAEEGTMASPAWAHEDKIQVVTIDSGGRPDRDFKISKSRNEQVKWVGPKDVPFTVEFKGESPFYESQFSNDYPYSGSIRRVLLGNPKKKYHYCVQVGDKDPVDPSGVVDR
jgi:hypothetical protein